MKNRSVPIPVTGPAVTTAEILVATCVLVIAIAPSMGTVVPMHRISVMFRPVPGTVGVLETKIRRWVGVTAGAIPPAWLTEIAAAMPTKSVTCKAAGTTAIATRQVASAPGVIASTPNAVKTKMIGADRFCLEISR